MTVPHPPEHIRGKLGYFTDPHLRAERREWVVQVWQAGVPQHVIGGALGIGQASVCRILKDAKQKPRSRTRSAIRNRCGVHVGSFERAIDALTEDHFDALEARCARTGETIAEALVAHWSEGCNDA